MSDLNLSIFGEFLEIDHPLALTAKFDDGTTPNYNEALKGPYREEFKCAIKRELDELDNKGVWVVLPKSSIPIGVKVINFLWAFKIKLKPDGSISKFKAQLCARGDQQKGDITPDEAYSPVVNWSTVRMLFTLSLIHDWHGRQIDYVNAFCQAEVTRDIYMNIPRGTHFIDNIINTREHILLLKKSLYGLKESSRCWFDTLKSGLIKRGFTQSTYDPCLFNKRGIIVVSYEDDCLVFSKRKQATDNLIQSLKRTSILQMKDQ
jgi:hypothetical protein